VGPPFLRDNSESKGVRMLPPIPVDEQARLEAVRDYRPFAPFDDAAFAPALELARDLFEVHTVFVGFIDRDEQVFPVRRGLDLPLISRALSFCAHASGRDDMLVVLDATLDPRFADNPLVTGAPHVRFYAGAPLVSPAGRTIGTLCLVDDKPRNLFSTASRRHLSRLAGIVLDRLELRRLKLAGGVSQVRFENIAATSPDGIICADADGRITFWNAASERLFGHSAAVAVGSDMDLIVPERLHKAHHGGMKRVADGAPTRLVGRVVELMAKRGDGSEFPIELSLSMWQEESGFSFGAIVRDITGRRANEDRLFRLAHHDPLTELPNRIVLSRRIEQLAGGTAPAALLVMDLDGFKTINDDLGNAAGDAVLRVVAQRLLGCVRTTDTVARLGGDEFALLLGGVGDHEQAGEIAATVIAAVSQALTVDGETLSVGGSVGVAVHPRDGRTSDELLSSAHLALYRAKSDGRHCHRGFTPGLRSAAERARAYDNELRRAHDGGEFEVFYQPQVRLSDEVLVGAEALLRWRHPVDGLLAPASFMAGLDNRPISFEVGQWVMRTACAQAARWRRAGRPGFRIAVNLFGSQFRSGDLVDRVREALAASGLPADGLELEITENIILRHDETMLSPLRTLRAQGVRIAFDDYGTGYASLSMLKRFPMTRLKVDKSFVQGMCESPDDAAIVQAILYLGRSLGLSIIAEGVETEEQAERLRGVSCEEGQGYLFGRPMPAGEFSARFGLVEAFV
jgi:diguanylate cyclase (GGDEF)-like protein/PAS domain S-box-containing protein